MSMLGDAPASREPRLPARSIAASWRNGMVELPPPILWVVDIVVRLVIAVPICLAIGMLLWCLAERAGWRSRRKAAQLGTLAGAVVAIGFGLVMRSGSRLRDIGFSERFEAKTFDVSSP